MIRTVAGLALAMSVCAGDGCLNVSGNNNGSIPLAEFLPINTKGYCETVVLAFDKKVATVIDNHIVNLRADAYRSVKSGTMSKDKWSVELNYDYKVNGIYSLNNLTRYKEDRLSGFDYQFFMKPGIGVKVIDREKYKFDVQADLVYGQDKPALLPIRDSLSSKVGAIYQWQIEDDLRLIEESTFRFNLEERQNYFIYTKVGIENRVNRHVSMGINYKINFLNMFPSLNSDRTFLVSLIIAY
ncbi:MAG: DUF481 domain-containing protein [Sulfuricurvum sp.]|uniref:DUF481 domain-containing protein n=1 Tax=Sulfuricurvum sp. TaxID=2025608 RepID=UPI0025FCB3B9|nr:DUF481 domain-containing protein [Sulfuricurvum sp.]MCK9371936.1 DUF481 domain-containing protein [Sulfuricurvum sp.]